jgi:hypothetical protein
VPLAIQVPSSTPTASMIMIASKARRTPSYANRSTVA